MAGSGCRARPAHTPAIQRLVALPLGQHPLAHRAAVDEFGFHAQLVGAAEPAGYPTGDDAEPQRINLYALLVEHPDETYVLKATGESMLGAGINPGDMLVVDPKKPATDGAIV